MKQNGTGFKKIGIAPREIAKIDRKAKPKRLLYSYQYNNKLNGVPTHLKKNNIT